MPRPLRCRAKAASTFGDKVPALCSPLASSRIFVNRSFSTAPPGIEDPPPNYNQFVELEKTLLRKVGGAIHRFKMIRDGDRVAVALSGGKDSLTLLEALLLLAERA